MAKANTATIPVYVDYIADNYSYYLGEEVTFYVCLKLQQKIDTQITINVKMPFELEPSFESSWALGHDDQNARLAIEPSMYFSESPYQNKLRVYRTVFWKVDAAKFEIGKNYEYMLKSKVAVKNDDKLRSWAEVSGVVVSESDNGTDEVDTTTIASDILTIEVKAKADSIKHLPSVYHHESQQLLWRYMMTFDSFWKRIDEYINNMSYYLDPRLAPPHFQNWLATWVGMVWDERIPEKRRKELIFQIVDLFQKRGTKYGLQRYLQICLDVLDAEVDRRIQIDENPTGNFVLGSDIIFGGELIMGSPEDVACMFTVTLDLEQPYEEVDEGFIKEIIETWKPAHTTYELFFN